MNSLTDDIKFSILSFIKIEDIIHHNILLPKYIYNQLSNKNKYRYLVYLIEKNLKVFLDFFEIDFLVKNRNNIFCSCIFNLIIYVSPLYLVKYFVNTIFPKLISMLNLENESIIECQYITFHKGIMDDACRADRFDIVKYMYGKTNQIYSSNISCSKYKSKVYHFLIDNCTFVQYKNLSND